MTRIFGFTSAPAALNSYLLLDDDADQLRAIIVDTGAGPRQAGRILDAFSQVCRDITGLELITEIPTSVVITHDHWDHFFGAATFAARGVSDFYASAETIAEMTASAWVQFHEVPLEHEPDLPSDPSALLVDMQAIEDGAELVIPGVTAHVYPGHTNGDLILLTGDVAIVGDLVEESAAPSIGPDATPVRWASNLTRIAELPGVTLFAPGHGKPVSREFVRVQAHDLAEAARTQSEELPTRVETSWSPLPGDYPEGVFRLR